MGNDQSLLCSDPRPPRNSRYSSPSRAASEIDTPFPKQVDTTNFKVTGSLPGSIRSNRSPAMKSMMQKRPDNRRNKEILLPLKSGTPPKGLNNSSTELSRKFMHMDVGDEKTGSFRGIQAPSDSSLLPCILFTFFYPDDRFDEYLLRNKTNKPGTIDPGSGMISKIRGIIEDRIIHNLRTYPYFSSHSEWNFLEDLYSKDLSKMNKDPAFAFDFLFNEVLEIKAFLEFSKFETGFLHQLLCPRYIGDATNIRISDLISFKTGTAPALCSPFLILEIKRVNYNTPFVFPLELDLQVSDPKSKGQLELYAVICIPPHDHGSWKAFVRTRNDSDPSISWLFYDPQSQGLMDSCQYNIPKVEHLPDFESHLSYLRTSKTATANAPILHDGSLIGQRLKTLVHLGHLFIYYDPDDPRLGHKNAALTQPEEKQSISSLSSNPDLNVQPPKSSKPEESDDTSKSRTISTNGDNTPKDDTKRNKMKPPLPKDKETLNPPPISTKSSNLSTKEVLRKALDVDEFKKLFISQYKDGKGVGLEGRDNSCYIDALLFSMFYISKTFDEVLLFPNLSTNPCGRFEERIRNILQFDIIDNLRRNHFVPYGSVAKLREAVGEINPRLLRSNSEMDLEEFIQSLMGKALGLPKFLNYSIGTGDFVHQISVHNNNKRSEGEDSVNVTDVQALVEQSMRFQNLKLSETPCPAFFIKLPKAQEGLGWDELVPNLTLDIRGIMEKGSKAGTNTKMDLSAVIILKNGHYSAYVRMGLSPLSQWLYFDSIPPRVKHVPNLGEELDFASRVLNGLSNGEERKWSRHFHRVITNPHLLIYFSPEAVLEMKGQVEELII